MSWFSYIKSGIDIVCGYAIWIFDIISGRKSRRTLMRLEICSECKHNRCGICMKCGCIIKAKVRVDFMLDEDGKSIEGCPERKW